MKDDERELAENCYGYGRWDAPFWFVGLEEGQARRENNNFTERAKAFRELNKDGLCDCGKFHTKIDERRWFEVNPKTGKVDLQSTWRYLILTLMSFQETLDSDEPMSDSLRAYQCAKWGAADSPRGETCVIELSGLPANNAKLSKERPNEMRQELEKIRPKRIERIRDAIRCRKPAFVVMYGMTAKEHWRGIAGAKLQACVPQKVESTIFLLAQHPTSRYKKGEKKDKYWTDLGVKLRQS